MSKGVWWPWELGAPTQSGIWNLSRFAYFPNVHVLAVKQAGKLVLYDTARLEFRGVAQDKGDAASFVFLSQYGAVSVETLPTCELTSVSFGDS